MGGPGACDPKGRRCLTLPAGVGGQRPPREKKKDPGSVLARLRLDFAEVGRCRWA